jgi:hypothetical protein
MGQWKHGKQHGRGTMAYSSDHQVDVRR